MNVSQVMITKIVTLKPGQTLQEATRILAKAGISGAPVVDDDSNVVGILSEADIMARLQREGQEWDMLFLPSTISTMGVTVDFIKASKSDDVRALFEKMETETVAGAMTEDPVTIGPEAELLEAIRLMINKQINRLPVIGEGKLVGLFTRGDVLKGLAQG